MSLSPTQINWNNSYVYSTTTRRCAEVTIISHAWHENTGRQSRQPDSKVGGDTAIARSTRGAAWVTVTYMPDEDFQSEAETRKAVEARRTTEQQQP